MRSFKPFLRTLLVTSALGLSLGACREDELIRGAAAALPATMALQGYPQGAYDPYADPYARVPIGRPVSYDDAWAWGERSYALDRAFYQSPPDYGFDYDGYEPWVWQTDDRWAMYADPYRDDDYRYYYYEPGDVRPYFIRDDNYGYGFDDVGRLVVMYDLLGRIMPQSLLYQQDPIATDYYRRAYALRQASLQAQPVVITQQVWQAQAPVIVSDQSRWIQAATTQQPWVQYRTKTKDQFVRAFDDERQRRERGPVVARQDRGFLGLPIGRRAERQEAPAEVARLDNGVRGYPQPVTPGNGAAPSLAPKGRARAELRGQPGLDQAAAQHALAEQRRLDRDAERQIAEQRQAQMQQRHDEQARFERQARLQEQPRQRQAEQMRQVEQRRGEQRMAEQRQVQQRMAEVRQAEQRQAQAQERARHEQARHEQARHEQARQEQQAREAARQQQAQAEQQAREQARQQQAQRQEQARQQQAQAERQAREQARQQAQAQQQAAQQQAQRQEQARQQQAQAEKQAREQARQQAQAQQQAAQQQAAQQQAAQQQAAQPHGRNAAATDNAPAQASAPEHGKGKGRNK